MVNAVKQQDHFAPINIINPDSSTSLCRTLRLSQQQQQQQPSSTQLSSGQPSAIMSLGRHQQPLPQPTQRHKAQPAEGRADSSQLSPNQQPPMILHTGSLHQANPSLQRITTSGVKNTTFGLQQAASIQALQPAEWLQVVTGLSLIYFNF